MVMVNFRLIHFIFRVKKMKSGSPDSLWFFFFISMWGKINCCALIVRTVLRVLKMCLQYWEMHINNCSKQIFLFQVMTLLGPHILPFFLNYQTVLFIFGLTSFICSYYLFIWVEASFISERTQIHFQWPFPSCFISWMLDRMPFIQLFAAQWCEHIVSLNKHNCTAACFFNLTVSESDLDSDVPSEQSVKTSWDSGTRSVLYAWCVLSLCSLASMTRLVIKLHHEYPCSYIQLKYTWLKKKRQRLVLYLSQLKGWLAISLNIPLSIATAGWD